MNMGPEFRRGYNAKYRKNNKNDLNRRSALWREKNPERVASYLARYRDANPERAAEVRSRHNAKKNGHEPLIFLPGETIAGLIERQKGLCSVCGEVLAGRTVVDHCHKTGRVRAILHNCCNTVLGLSKESPEILRRAASYLESHSARILNSTECANLSHTSTSPSISE